MELRTARYNEMSAALASLSDAEVSELLASAAPHAGWGASRSVEFGTGKVFAKALPLTDLEVANPYGTQNMYSLPMFYQYGVGSAGFGVFRELAAHAKASEWVLAGETTGVPLVYHHRILAEPAGARDLSAAKIEWFESYWDNSSEVRKLLQARQDSTHTLVIFIEWFPHVLQTWFTENPDAIEMIVEQVEATLQCLRTRGMVHFDANLSNIVTDGETVALTDFGLALDSEFDLSAEEEDFLAAHHLFDSGEFLLTLTQPNEDTQDPSDLPAIYHNTIRRYEGVIAYMSGFFERLQQGSKANGRYDDDVLRKLLEHARS